MVCHKHRTGQTNFLVETTKHYSISNTLKKTLFASIMFLRHLHQNHFPPLSFQLKELEELAWALMMTAVRILNCVVVLHRMVLSLTKMVKQMIKNFKMQLSATRNQTLITFLKLKIGQINCLAEISKQNFPSNTPEKIFHAFINHHLH
jgi:hypothetical protein